MNPTRRTNRLARLEVFRILFLIGLITRGAGPVDAGEAGTEPPVRKVPGFYSAAEAYFSPDGRSLIFDARRDADEEDYHVYVSSLDGQEIRRINDRGFDACAYFFPDGKRLVFTSTRDNPQLPKGDYSVIADYPRGAELYVANLDGSDRIRLTHNEFYEAEVSVSPDGEWILFTRMAEGRLDLWRMRPDGSDETRVTDTPDWQEGGAFYLPDGEHIIFRAWRLEEQDESPKPMTIFTMRHDGTGRRQVTHDPGMNWAPYPAPDGRSFAFVKVLPPHNFEIFRMDLETGEQTRMTFNDAFDAYPAFSPDGRTLCFSSSRASEAGSHTLGIYLMDLRPSAPATPGE